MNNDWIERLESLVDKVDFLIIAAWAMAYHGQSRYTDDLGIFFRPTETNAAALIQSLRAFGAPTHSLSVAELAVSGFTVTFGAPPVRVDLLNWLSGVDYDDAASDAEKGKLGPVEVLFLSRRALIKNKAASGRPKDLLDIQILGPQRGED